MRVMLGLALAGLLAGCAGQVRPRSGATGQALPPASSLAIVGIQPEDAPLAVKARAEVSAALGRRGHAVAPGGADRIEIGLTDRAASTGIAVIGGEELSPAKRRRFLQTCKERTYRLVLTRYGAGSDVPVTRAWAEEHHCRGAVGERIAGLAENAVAALATGTSSDFGVHPARD